MMNAPVNFESRFRRDEIIEKSRYSRVRMKELEPMKVLSVTSEMYPLIKTGGLADVTGSLPKALANCAIP